MAERSQRALVCQRVRQVPTPSGPGRGSLAYDFRGAASGRLYSYMTESDVGKLRQCRSWVGKMFEPGRGMVIDAEWGVVPHHVWCHRDPPLHVGDKRRRQRMEWYEAALAGRTCMFRPRVVRVDKIVVSPLCTTDPSLG